jgi:hypothetical protein
MFWVMGVVFFWFLSRVDMMQLARIYLSPSRWVGPMESAGTGDAIAAQDPKVG